MKQLFHYQLTEDEKIDPPSQPLSGKVKTKIVNLGMNNLFLTEGKTVPDLRAVN